MAISKRQLSAILIIVSAVCTVVMFFIGAIPQDNSFHHFADTRTIANISNCWNVVSNAGFLMVGLLAVQKLRSGKMVVVAGTRSAYYFFFTGILMVSIGSAWYHLHPGNTTLVFDRLPMTIAFMSLLSIGIAEFLSVNAARIVLIPLIITGILSIAWWYYGELHHKGDLRLYALVQYLPVLLLTLLFFIGHCMYNTKWGYIALFVSYAFAKLAEHFDSAVYHITGKLLSGHTLKHIITATGIWLFLLYLQKRK